MPEQFLGRENWIGKAITGKKVPEETEDYLLIFGASARAAAFSALRAGLRPWCADLFADRDLEARCTAVRVSARDYPQAFLRLACQEMPGAWMYTGALENRRRLVREISSNRSLWGNGEEPLRRSRSPQFVASLFAKENLPYPRLQNLPLTAAKGERWVLKPTHGAGGTGIVLWTGQEQPPNSRPGIYCQEFIKGQPIAAVYVGDGEIARLMGVTQQLVGKSWLHAGRFQYCGSIGPVDLPAESRIVLETMGNVLARGCQLRGLFGVDFVLRDGTPFPLEINPRYTASVEVLEYATGWNALADHRRIFDPFAPPPIPRIRRAREQFTGKAILFSRDTIIFPDDGPWLASLRSLNSVQAIPSFADLPHAGERIERGRPILTLFARATTLSGCADSLQQIARDLDRWRFGP